MSDGITTTNRVDGTTERILDAMVTDNILNTPTWGIRAIGMGKNFVGKSRDYTVKVSRTGQGEWFSGMPALNSSATDTTVTLSFRHAAYSHPIVIPIEEAMANQGSAQTIPLIAFKSEEAHQECMADLGDVLHGTGSGDNPLGLGAIIDDGTSVGTIGGQSRTTYTALKATRTASGGNLTLAKLATLFSAVSKGSRGGQEAPTVHVVTPTVFDLYEQLLHPSVRMNLDSQGYSMLPIRGNKVVKAGQLMGAAGFNVLSYRGVPVLADNYATSGYWNMVNENYIDWIGRSIVPAEFSGQLSKVNLGKAKTIEGQQMLPSNYNGIFMTKMNFHPDQPGAIKRLYVFGQLVGYNFRRQGVLTGITGV